MFYIVFPWKLKVVSFDSYDSYTVLPMFVKFLETHMESIFQNLRQLLHRFGNNIVRICVLFLSEPISSEE